MLERLIGKKVRVYLKNGFLHSGTVIEATDVFIALKDEKKQLDVIINAAMIDRVLEEEQAEQ